MKIKGENFKLGMVFIAGILLIGLFIIILNSISLVSAEYFSSSTQYTNPGVSSFGYSSSAGIHRATLYTPILGEQECGMTGQDFILQIAPTGCVPAVVRSDLLEEQNVPVFCPIVATKLNPLIDVEAIRQISFKGQYPREVAGVGFHPARAAVSGYQTFLGSSVLSNIGYVVIVLKQQVNESVMPEYIQGNLTAVMRYDIKNAFGAGQAEFYLPEMDDFKWDETYRQYVFWNGNGFLRAEHVGPDNAIISVYRDKDAKISSVNLKKGQTSEKIYMPGFYCLASLQVQLESIENSNTRARIKVNADVFEVIEGQKFLDNKCQIRKIEKIGLAQKVTIICQADEKAGNFVLSILPKINLKIDDYDNKEGYFIGDMLFSDGGGNSAYLAYANTKRDSGKQKDLVVYVLEKKALEDKLSETELSSIAKQIKLDAGKKDVIDWSGGKLHKLDISKEITILNKKINLVGFIEPINKYSEDIDLEKDPNNYYGKFKTSFDNAIKDYKTLVKEFPDERQDIQLDVSKSYAEIGLQEAIELADDTGQKLMMNELLQRFVSEYPQSDFAKIADEKLSNAYKTSNTETSSRGIIINGMIRTISFEGIHEPNYEEYGVGVVLRDKKGKANHYYLGKSEKAYFSDTEYIELKEIRQDIAVFSTNIKPPKKLAFNPDNIQVKLNDNKIIDEDKGYSISVDDINVKRVAKVKIIPGIEYTGTEANFPFKIGIEKRAIELSPDKIKEKIEELNKTIEKWADISEGLGDLVKGFKAACLATGAILTVKNFVENINGKGISRQMVMNNEGGWKDVCKKEVAEKRFPTMDACFYNYRNEIDNDVSKTYTLMKKQNEVIKETQKDFETSTAGGKVVDTDKFMKKYISDEYRASLIRGFTSAGLTNIRVGGEDVLIDKIVSDGVNYDGYNKGVLSVSDARELELLSQVMNDPGISPQLLEALKKSASTKLENIYRTSRDIIEAKSLSDEYGIRFDSYGDKQSIVGNYYGDVAGSKITALNSEITTGTPVQGVIYGGKKYILELGLTYGNKYHIKNIYYENGKKLDKEKDDKKIFDEINRLFSKGFVKYDRTSYENKYIDPKAHYFETEPYKGLPAIVPFDTVHGWYAATKQTLPVFGAIGAYEESGRVSSVYVCNVGENGRQQFDSGIGDDICELINLGTGQPYDQFPGLQEGEAIKLIRSAVQAIEQASRQYKPGIRMIKISTAYGSYNIPVGEPQANIPEMQCQDFMSPKDCHILFNVCDPVICPPSRCNLGGTYYVKDVIQSGIIGSIALCLPNYKEGILAPICLTGIKAGIDGLLSIQRAYRDCLQESLDTGKMVGICDEIYSIYMCEFFWRQAVPFAKMIIPKILEAITGKGTRGGGEYLGLSSAWENAQKSVDYFTQVYGVNSYKAFKARTMEDVGSEVCKNFMSASFPASGEFLDALIEPDSPTQFHAWFHEIPFTSTTVPPISQYKVFYHIYAGKDRGAYFQVYLTSPEGSSFYYDNPTVVIRSSYIPVGEYADETRDFTAPSGYKQLCVRVNAQEECGFKQVSTSFALDYLKEKYLEEQASKTDIISTKECVSGNPSLYNMISPNIQEGVSDVINPELYDRGIIRVCSTDDPGKGTDAKSGTNQSRWVVVGHCDDPKMKCWLDTQSVKRNVDITTIESRILSEVNAEYQKLLGIEGEYLEDIKNKIDEFEKQVGTNSQNEAILIHLTKDITDAYETASWTNQRAHLLLLRARTYGNLARIYFDKLKEALASEKEPIVVPQVSGDVLTSEPGVGNYVIDRYESIYLRKSDGWWLMKKEDNKLVKNTEYGVLNWEMDILIYEPKLYNPSAQELEEVEEERGVGQPKIIIATTEEVVVDVDYCYTDMRIELYKDAFWIFDNEVASQEFDEDDVGDGEITINTPSDIEEGDKIYVKTICGSGESTKTKSVEVVEGARTKDIKYEKLNCNEVESNTPLSVEYASCISKDKINKILALTPAKNTGEIFVDLGKQYNIDPIIALAFFNKESNFGTQGVARETRSIGNIKFTNNCPTGVNYQGFCRYTTWKQSIEHWYELISSGVYVAGGKNTVETIIPKYCPATDGCDVDEYIKIVRDFVIEHKSV